MSTYAWFHVLVGLPPLIAALAPWRFGWTRQEWRRFGWVALGVSLPWIVLDALSHARGWWAYAPEHVWAARLLGLPVEEVLFFVTVPFACLFLLTSLQRVMLTRQIDRRISDGLRYGAIILAGIVAWLLPYERSIADSLLLIVVVSASLWLWRRWTRTDVVWWCLVIALFFICNTVLTALPIVTYDHAYGSMVRLGTIPLEDLLYNLSLLGCAYLVFMRPWAARLQSAAPLARR